MAELEKEFPEAHELLRAATWISRQLAEMQPLPPDHVKLDSFTVGRGTLRAMLPLAFGICGLTINGQGDATAPLVRTMFELWADQSFLFKCCYNQEESARRWLAFEVLELRDHARSAELDTAVADMTIEKYRSQDSGPLELAEEQRAAKNQRHWSGLQRTQVLDRVEAAMSATNQDLRKAYKVLSWGSHGNLEVSRRMGTWSDPPEWPADIGELSAHQAAPLLKGAWEIFSGAFGLPLRPSAG